MSKNSRYSLRAFARDLKVEPARLSDVLNGKKGLSRGAAEAWATRLGWSSTEIEFFCDLVESEHARTEIKRKLAKKKVLKTIETKAKSIQLTLDAFRTISDWYPMAILELLKLPRTQSSTSWIARELDLQEVQVVDAITRLERLNLIQQENGKWVPTPKAVFSPDGISSDAIKRFHEQILTKASQALYTQSVDDRDFYTYVMPARRADIPKIRERVRSFFKSLVSEFGNAGDSDQVISVSNQVISLTKPCAEQSPRQKIKGEEE